MLSSIRVTLHAVLEVTDAFLQVFSLNFLRIVLVAAVARVLFEVRCDVAGLAWDIATLAMIKRESMIERRALPGLCCMTLSAIRAKCA